jgi:ubiquinone/menaquinone biosynthesis C-methylase UbiE
MITIDFNRLDLKPGNRILDIGCGEGRHTAKAWESPEIFCVGADRSHKDLVTSKTKLQLHEELSVESAGLINWPHLKNGAKLKNGQISQKSSKWALIAADITQLPFGNNCFDVIICSEVMEHIRDEKRALAELKRVLKKGGFLALSVPRYWPEKICWKLSHEYGNSAGGHIRIYKKEELLTKIIPLGFQFQGSHYAHSLHSPFWWIKCLIGLNKKDADSVLITIYHRLLVWDIMEKPFITGIVEKLLNPVMGKSLALYFTKITG